MQKLSNLKSTGVDTVTFKNLPPFQKEAVLDFIDVYNKEKGDCITRVETAIDKVAEHHNINTQILYDYVDNQIEEILGVK